MKRSLYYEVQYKLWPDVVFVSRPMTTELCNEVWFLLWPVAQLWTNGITKCLQFKDCIGRKTRNKYGKKQYLNNKLTWYPCNQFNVVRRCTSCQVPPWLSQSSLKSLNWTSWKHSTKHLNIKKTDTLIQTIFQYGVEDQYARVRISQTNKFNYLGSKEACAFWLLYPLKTLQKNKLYGTIWKHFQRFKSAGAQWTGTLKNALFLNRRGRSYQINLNHDTLPAEAGTAQASTKSRKEKREISAQKIAIKPIV